jgi:para-aminobenzoate synthetase/4-amino-4-deoxychorismate lyase
MNSSVQSIVFDPDKKEWLHFRSPSRIISATSIEEVLAALADVERIVASESKWAVGWVSYEASPAFDPSFVVQTEESFPKVWFALFDEPDTTPTLASTPQSPPLSWSPTTTERKYAEAIEQVRQRIKEGDTYQVNYSFRLTSKDSREPLTLFASMVAAQAGTYSCFISTDTFSLASASPELFFRKDGNTLLCKPMKGTIRRGVTVEEDNALAHTLQTSRKDRAENIMIVDMTRNDLSRIAERASVTTPQVCSIEKYPHMFQMTSDVVAQSSSSLVEIFQALFPAASITGAPKTETMRIIAELEDTPRKIYTGALGVVSPHNRMWFNVAIRTALFDHAKATIEYGVGSGVVWDSACTTEYKECLAKAAAVTKTTQPFELFETILWEPAKGFYLTELHIERILTSAHYFSWTVSCDAVTNELERVHHTLSQHTTHYRVRIFVHPSGAVRSDCHPLSPLPSPYTAALAQRPINSDDVWLFHKTTNREIYESAIPSQSDAHDVILWNERGEITETKIANIVIRIDGHLYTPPITSGLLGGCLRRHLIESGEIAERVITTADLLQAQGVFLINSLRGMWRAELKDARPFAPTLSAST